MASEVLGDRILLRGVPRVGHAALAQLISTSSQRVSACNLESGQTPLWIGGGVQLGENLKRPHNCLMPKVDEDWEKQPRDQGIPPRKHFVLWGVFLQFGLTFMVFTGWFILNIPGRVPHYDQVPTSAEQWRNVGHLLESVSAEMKETGDTFALDSAWLLPALLAVVIACYAVVVAGGRADIGTPIRALRPLMTSITILIGTIVWLWGGVLVLEASFGHLLLPELWLQ